eukprot:COSAG01_NODE_3467_length_6056_cov_2.509820_7_plen_95_part_00
MMEPSLVWAVLCGLRSHRDVCHHRWWAERWARITVPDRALTIGTLRYAHRTGARAPSWAQLQVRGKEGGGGGAVRVVATVRCLQCHRCQDPSGV